jgi:hypothetical protein
VRVDWIHIDNIIPHDVKQEIITHIQDSFIINEEVVFCVNPTIHFKKVKKKLNPAVINSAKYLSGGFQGNLKQFGWEIDINIKDQEIDGYIEFDTNESELFQLSRQDYLSALSSLDLDSADYSATAKMLHNCYYQRNIYHIPETFSHLPFTKVSEKKIVKVGLEFETGNIASSFRALSKLNYLFDLKEIDVGVFITSVDKSVSTGIWPSSNRNGSLQELDKRAYRHEIKFPCLIAGFSPDKWDDSATFLGEDGVRFLLNGSTKIVNFKGKKYKYYDDSGYYVEILTTDQGGIL